MINRAANRNRTPSPQFLPSVSREGRIPPACPWYIGRQYKSNPFPSIPTFCFQRRTNPFSLSMTHRAANRNRTPSPQFLPSVSREGRIPPACAWHTRQPTGIEPFPLNSYLLFPDKNESLQPVLETQGNQQESNPFPSIPTFCFQRRTNLSRNRTPSHHFLPSVSREGRSPLGIKPLPLIYYLLFPEKDESLQPVHDTQGIQ